jgi:deazaflavin-dependent oxidoreductase (nitroreductase family)
LPVPATYQKPGFVTNRIFNPLLAGIVKLGMSPRGANILSVRGRKSGEWRSTPVNPLAFNGERYLVAPRGDTHWSRNIRASGEGRLRVGRTTRDIEVVEVPDAEKPDILRAYLSTGARDRQVLRHRRRPDRRRPRPHRPDHPVFKIVAQ